jgi:tetratricopeptide (TPR) repeat protein
VQAIQGAPTSSGRTGSRGRGAERGVIPSAGMAPEDGRPTPPGNERPTAPISSDDDTLPAATAPGIAALPVRDPARYTRLDEIARGGMGRIVSARDEELGRPVAIKELLAPSDALERRFEREVRITSTLQHPGIIAVQDAGRWPGGSAFYTMPRVEGRALREAIADATTIEQRLALVANVIAVADALAYAHGRSVIHRDLKPANVLVGTFGETIVIDWGLAKDLDADANEEVASGGGVGEDGLTVFGEAIGTPAYMPPEQARGDAIDARADVYAIGAILYHVLGRRPPYDGTASAHETVKRVLAGPPTALDEIAPEVPADLRALVRKAMARDPGDRYPTAAELAHDLRRFTTGQLVAAHRYSTRQLVARWIARHRAVVAVASAGALALAIVAVVAFQRVRDERDEAAAQRARAEEHRARVEGLFDFMLIDLHRRLDTIGQLELLRVVADEAASYYTSRPVEGMAADEARRRGIAHVRVGNVRIAAGDLPGALEAFRDAVAVFERIGAEREVPKAHDQIGTVLARQGEPDAALAAYRQALAIRERLAAAAPEDPAVQRDLRASYNQIGRVLTNKGELAAALELYRDGHAISERLARDAPDDVRAQQAVAVARSKIGDVLVAQANLDEALVEYRAATAIMEHVVAREPESLTHQYHLSAAMDNVAYVLRDQGDVAGALSMYRASLAIMERLVERDPANTEWQQGVSIGHVAVGDMLHVQRDLAAAAAAFDTALAIRARLAEQDPSNTEWQHDLAVALGRVASIALERGDPGSALRGYRDSLAVFESLNARDPSNVLWARNLADAHAKLGRVHQRRGDMAAARRAFDAAVAHADRLVAANPEHAEYRRDAEDLRAEAAGCCVAAAP